MNFSFKYLFSQRRQINSKEPSKELQQQDKLKGKVIYVFSFENFHAFISNTLQKEKGSGFALA